MNCKTKLIAGALQYSIFISILITIIVFAFISLSFLQSKIKIRSRLYKSAIQNVNYAFQYANRNELPYRLPFYLTKDIEKRDTILLINSTWGVFDLVKVHSKVQNESFKKVALLGGHQKDRTALTLQDLNRPLVLVGNTRIEGNVILPGKGVKRGSIGGKSYFGSQLIYGAVESSHVAMPKLKIRDEILKMNEDLFDDQEIEVFDQLSTKKVRNSFFKKTLLISSWKTLVLEEMDLKGNILIHSDSLIFVSRSVLLEDVILTAPTIIIEDGVRGSFQAIASNCIEVGSNCELNYPSCLIVVENVKTSKEINNSGQIVIKDNSKIKGVIAYLTDQAESNNKVQIYIGDKVTVIGEIYCEMNIELKGTILGMVRTRGFVANHNGASYQNHILNGQIIENGLPAQYCGLAMENNRKGTVKWLY